ncbi:G2 and S phase [Cricetulus griseus]|nr:G2 and S phase [Cricetulus griseus]
MEGGDGCDVPSSIQARGVKMDTGSKKEDILLLEDEKFDFDLSLSSSSANEDDEVFFGPVGHKERCIAASLDLSGPVPGQTFTPASGSPCTWSPLTGEKFVEVYKEAHLLALQIESHSRREVAQAAKPQNPVNQGMERFVQDSQLKISLFEKEQKREKSPMSLKRETFCLPSSGGQPLLGEPQPLTSPAMLSSPIPTGPVQTQSNQALPCSSQSLPGESRTSQPPNQAGPQRRTTSKLQPPRALPVRGRHLHLATEKLGLKKTLLKPPAYTDSLTRRSSASGSASNLISSACVSPGAGRANSSDLSNIPTSGSRPLSNTSKLGKVGPAPLHQALKTAPTRASCRQTRRAGAAQTMAEQPKASNLTPLGQQPQTPEQRGPRLDPDTLTSSQLNKTGSIKRRDSYLNCKTEAVSTTTDPFKVPQFSVGESANGVTPKLLQTHQLQPRTPASRVLSSTPVRRSLGPTQQGLPGSMRTPVSMRRMSTLPTPASRRLSGLPLMAPQSMPRALASPLCVPARRLSSEPRRRSTVRVEPTQESRSNANGGQGQGQSSDESSSAPSCVPQALDFSPNKSESPPSHGSTTEAAQGETEPHEDNTSPTEGLLLDIKLDQLTITPEAGGRDLADRPLIDFSNTPESNMALGPSSWPLIDLVMNTPDMGRNDVGKPPKAELGQLIDLGSPLIHLSPEADKENVDSPLLKF